MADPEAGARRAPRQRIVLLLLIAALYVASVPWYRAPDAPLRLWLGLPDWVTTALGCYVAAAVLNAWAWWTADVRDPDDAAAVAPGTGAGDGGAGDAP